MSPSGSSLTDTLRIYGNLSLLEMAPVLLAAGEIYPGKTLLKHGSVMSLWGKSSDLASLGSGGQSDGGFPAFTPRRPAPHPARHAPQLAADSAETNC